MIVRQSKLSITENTSGKQIHAAHKHSLATDSNLRLIGLHAERSMPSLRLQLNISADEMLEYYRGTAKSVHARAANGQTVQFPASALQKFVTKEGIHGTFDLFFDDQKKFLDLKRSATPKSGLDRTV